MTTETEIEVLRRELAQARAERDALAAAMPSEGADAALAYAAEHTRAEANAKDAERWNALCELWHASTEFHGTQDEDGRWSLWMIEAVEQAWTPGRWTGDTPDDAIDYIVTELAESEALEDAAIAASAKDEEGQA